MDGNSSKVSTSILSEKSNRRIPEHSFFSKVYPSPEAQARIKSSSNVSIGQNTTRTPRVSSTFSHLTNKESNQHSEFQLNIESPLMKAARANTEVHMNNKHSIDTECSNEHENKISENFSNAKSDWDDPHLKINTEPLSGKSEWDTDSPQVNDAAVFGISQWESDLLPSPILARAPKKVRISDKSSNKTFQLGAIQETEQTIQRPTISQYELNQIQLNQTMLINKKRTRHVLICSCVLIILLLCLGAAGITLAILYGGNLKNSGTAMNGKMVLDLDESICKTVLFLSNPTFADGNFTFYSYSLRATKSQATLSFGFQHNTNFWTLDNISVFDGSANILINGDFEAGLNYTGWIGANHLSTTGCYSGTYCYRDGHTRSFDYVSQSFALTIGHVYNISFYLSSGHDSSGATANITIIS